MSGGGLLLIMAFEAKVGISGGEHFLVHAAMGIMTGGAAFAHGCVFKDMRSALLGMAFETGFIGRSVRGEATLDGPAFMRVMTIRATHLALFERMMIRQAEISALLQVTLKAGFRIAPRINDGARLPAGLVVDAARAMAGFAAHLAGIFAFGQQSRVVRRVEFFGNFLMALHAAFRADECGPGNLWRGNDRVGKGAAGNDQHGGERGNQNCYCLRAMIARPHCNGHEAGDKVRGFHAIGPFARAARLRPVVVIAPEFLWFTLIINQKFFLTFSR